MSNKNNQPTQKGWKRASVSPMPGNVTGLMSPAPNVARQRSQTPTFNARHLSENPTFKPGNQPTTPGLKGFKVNQSGLTTVFDSSQSFMQSQPQESHKPQANPSTSYLPNISLQSSVSFPRPFRSPFSPTQETPQRFLQVSSPLTAHQEQEQARTMDDFNVIPLEHGINREILVCEQDPSQPCTADIIAQQSQDYVDEKLAEYQATISLLQGE